MSYGSKECEVERIVYDPSLVLYLPLWKRDGTSIQSDDAYGHTCTVTNASWGVQGRTFGGTDDVINCGSAASLDIHTNITVVAWVKTASAGESAGGRIFAKGTTIFLATIDVDKVIFRIVVGAVNKNAISAGGTVPDGSFTHVAAVFNGVNVLVYTNLTLETGTGTVGPIDDHSGDDFLIGDAVGSINCLDGVIGELSVYNRALSPLEIQRNYEATKWRYQ